MTFDQAYATYIVNQKEFLGDYYYTSYIGKKSN
jgi:hypothetical protein